MKLLIEKMISLEIDKKNVLKMCKNCTCPQFYRIFLGLSRENTFTRHFLDIYWTFIGQLQGKIIAFSAG